MELFKIVAPLFAALFLLVAGLFVVEKFTYVEGYTQPVTQVLPGDGREVLGTRVGPHGQLMYSYAE